MATKQMLFAMVAFIFTNSLGAMHAAPQFNIPTSNVSQQKDFVFDRGGFTNINGNNVWRYLRFNRLQRNATPAFRHIRVMELTKEKDFNERGSLGSFQKQLPLIITDDKFWKHTAINNAIYCDDVEQAEDYDGKLYSVGAIVYRTQNLENCPLVREYVAQQKQLAEKNNAAELTVPATASLQK